MADNYLQFSFAYRLPKADAHLLKQIFNTDKEEGKNTDNPDKDLGGVYIVVDAEDETHADVTIYAEEYGNPDAVACTLRRFLKQQAGSLKVMGFEWAVTCSKPRVGEFGGGAVVVTNRGIRYMNTSTWLRSESDKTTKRLTKKRKG